jgi:hypothetical protein
MVAATAVLLAVAAIGCNAVATLVWVFKDGKTQSAEFDKLKNHTVAVVCRGPMQIQFRHEAQAPQKVARRVHQLLKSNLGRHIDLVTQEKIAKITDERQWDEFTDVGKELECDLVLAIDIERFAFSRSRSVYNGKASITITVYDMNQDGAEVYRKSMENIEFPPTIGGVDASEMTEAQFLNRFVNYVSEMIGKLFYDHDPRADYATYGLGG